MKAIVKWLERLKSAKQESLRELVVPVITPGTQSLDLTDLIVATEPKSVLPGRPGDTGPISLALLRYLDTRTASENLKDDEVLRQELNALFCLVSDRRVVIPNVMAVRMEGLPTLTFLAYGATADHRLHGPMPADLKTEIQTALSQVFGLPDNAQAPLGAAARLHQSAVQLFESDIRSAYLLLVAGIEVLSRAFGKPPEDWEKWEQHASWENLFQDGGFASDQRALVRSKLMKDRQLRLKGTFREYASTRVPDQFWEEKWQNWMFPFNITSGSWEEITLTDESTVQDHLPKDRVALSRALGHSYDLRSGLVHEGAVLNLMDSTIPFEGRVSYDGPLPFSLLRSLLRSLIRTEIQRSSVPVLLRDIRLQR